MDMKEKITERVQGLLAQRAIKGFLGLRRQGEHIAPYVFTDPAELVDLDLGDRLKPGDTRYSLVELLSRLAGQFPTDTFAILVRGCDERAIQRLMTVSRVTPLHPERVVPVGFSCPTELALACRCEKPWPDALDAGERTPGVDADLSDGTPTGDVLERLEGFKDDFARCVKCFGCRNVCPVCDCHECTMEIEALVPQRELPPSNSFLMTRAVHMVDRCVYCGLCEQACPADIPLKSIYRLVAALMGRDQAENGNDLALIPSRSNLAAGSGRAV